MPGIRISEHLPGVAKQMQHLAHRALDAHPRRRPRPGHQHLRTGYLPQGAIEFPTLGSLVAKEREQAEADLPSYVSITPRGMTPACAVAGLPWAARMRR